MTDNSKPEGYFDEITYSYSKKDEAIALLQGYTVIEHTNSENEYEYLEDNDVVLEIVNPYQGENIYIEFSGEFTLFFSDWHTHYCSYEYDFSLLKQDMTAIINGEYGALCFYVNDELMGCRLLREEISYLTSPNWFIEQFNFPEEHLKKIKDNGVVIKVDYWMPHNSYEFDVEKDSAKPYYKN